MSKLDRAIARVDRIFRDDSDYWCSFVTAHVTCPSCKNKELYITWDPISGIMKMKCPNGCFDYTKVGNSPGGKFLKHKPKSIVKLKLRPKQNSLLEI